LETLDFILLFGGTALIFIVIFAFKAKKLIRRKKLLAAPFPEKLEKHIEHNFRIYHSLPEDLKKQLKGLMNVFLDEKYFEGCQGLEVTDEMKATIAAQACLLLLNKKTSYYSRLLTILVYPEAYLAGGMSRMGNNVVHAESARLGESWLGGNVVLAWSHVKHGAVNNHDGHNVVIHEFAHQLDQETGAANGAPILAGINREEWNRIFSHDFEELQDEVRHGHRDVIDSYGATNPAEFFAVATETFFEKPKQLTKHHPELYKELKAFYKLDPIEWE
jgi:Mlc titration factor MtfA (ptsG expression regulator)